MKLFFSILLILFISSCKKDKCKTLEKKDDLLIDSSVNSFLFSSGTYWVYENSTTLELDSQRVVFSKDNNFIADNKPAPCTEMFSIFEKRIGIQSFFNNSIFDFIIRDKMVFLDPTSQGNHGGYQVFSGTINFETNNSKLIEVIDSLEVNGVYFKNVSKILINALPNSDTCLFISHNKTFMYLKDSIGIIKWAEDLGNGSFNSWELKSWNIIL